MTKQQWKYKIKSSGKQKSKNKKYEVNRQNLYSFDQEFKFVKYFPDKEQAWQYICNMKNWQKVKIGDFVKIRLSKNSEHLCGGHQMFDMQGKEIEAIIGYSNYNHEFYATDDGVTYTSERQFGEILEILDKKFDPKNITCKEILKSLLK